MEYRKRCGTTAISGQLYESKLLALVLFRLVHDERVEQFHLATNVEDAGAFDDICIKIKLAAPGPTLALFLQLKHKDSEDAFLSLDNRSDIIKYINSISTINNRIASRNSCDEFFNGDMDEKRCVLILYTNARFRLTSSVSNEDDHRSGLGAQYPTVLNDLLNTNNAVDAQRYTSRQHVEHFANILLEEDLKTLAEHFFTYLCDNENRSMNVMNDEFVQRYHVVLRQRVLDLSDVHTQPPQKWRYLTFQRDFLCSQDSSLAFFRDTLFNEVIKKLSKLSNKNGTQAIPRDVPTDETIEESISSFLSDASADTLRPLIGTHVVCDEDCQLTFLNDGANISAKLRQINISRQVIGEAYLRSLKVKVPISFGNMDLTVSGSLKRVERRLDHLVTAIVGLCERSTQETPYKVVTIDDTLDGGLLGSSGGLGAAVGNLLINDDETGMMKFSTDIASLPANARMLHDKLTTEMVRDGVLDMQMYKFDIKTKRIPKLSFDCNEDIKAFLSKLVVYEKQKNHYKLEELLKHEMNRRLNGQPNLCSTNAHSLFLHYHNEILKWWMSPSTGRYLTKASNLYEQAIDDVKAEPQICGLSTTFQINNSRYFACDCNEDATDWMEWTELPSNMFVVTDTVILTTMKVIKCLRDRYSVDKFAILDTECVLKLPPTEFISLIEELRKTLRLMIVVYHNIRDVGEVDSMLSKLTQVTEGKKTIVIMNKILINKLNYYFSNKEIELYEDKSQNLSAMTATCRGEIVKQSRIMFQGQELKLDSILDDVSLSFITGVILDKIMHDNIIHFGSSLSNPSYEEIKPLYIERRVSPVTASHHDTYDDVHLVTAFHDVVDQVVLLTAAPGMGKSTLLTHLSLQANKHDTKLFIVRVNFLDHSKQFYKWYRDRTVIDALESLMFLCQVILKTDNRSFTIKIIDGEANLTDCKYDEQAAFELKMFLHFYNQRRLIFVMDGFDEICPHYKDNVVKFLGVAKNLLHKNKMWVTSRPYSDILPALERVFGKCYKLERFSLSEQELYLERFWREKVGYDQVSEELNTKFINFLYIRTYLCQIGHGAIDVNEFDNLLKLKNQFSVAKMDNLSGSPLLLYFIADYFLHRVILQKNLIDFDSDINICNIYEMFIENKLKKILFQDKNKMDLCNPDIILKFEKERDQCTIVHKKLGAYCIFTDPVFKALRFKELNSMAPFHGARAKEISSLLTAIKEGADKIGLISHVTADNMPVFIHRTFAEYFAARYICDLINGDKFSSHQKTLFYYAILVCCYNGTGKWIDIIQEKDKHLRRIVKEIEARELKLLCDMSYLRWYFVNIKLSKGQFIRLVSSSAKDYDAGCLNKFIEELRMMTGMRGNEIADCIPFIEKLYSDLRSKMKPHLKKYFVENRKENRQYMVKHVKDEGQRNEKIPGNRKEIKRKCKVACVLL